MPRAFSNKKKLRIPVLYFCQPRSVQISLVLFRDEKTTYYTELRNLPVNHIFPDQFLVFTVSDSINIVVIGNKVAYLQYSFKRNIERIYSV